MVACGGGGMEDRSRASEIEEEVEYTPDMNEQTLST